MPLRFRIDDRLFQPRFRKLVNRLAVVADQVGDTCGFGDGEQPAGNTLHYGVQRSPNVFNGFDMRQIESNRPISWGNPKPI